MRRKGTSNSFTCPFYLFENTALEIQATEKLIFKSSRQRVPCLPYRDGLSYSDILNGGIGPTRCGQRVRFSPFFSSPAPASKAPEFISLPNEPLCIALRLSPPLPLLIDFFLLLLLFPCWGTVFWRTALLLVQRLPSGLTPHRFPSIILNVGADLGLLLLVLGRRPHLLRLMLGLEPGPGSLPPPYFRFLFSSSSGALFFFIPCCCLRWGRGFHPLCLDPFPFLCSSLCLSFFYPSLTLIRADSAVADFWL